MIPRAPSHSATCSQSVQSEASGSPHDGQTGHATPVSKPPAGSIPTSATFRRPGMNPGPTPAHLCRVSALTLITSELGINVCRPFFKDCYLILYHVICLSKEKSPTQNFQTCHSKPKAVLHANMQGSVKFHLMYEIIF